MVRRVYLPVVFLLSTIFITDVYAQTGEIKGKVTEGGSKEGVPFASVAALQDGAQVIATTADIDGNYVLKPLTPGRYDVQASSVGYTTTKLPGVIVSVDNISYANIEMAKGVTLGTVEVLGGYKIPLIDAGTPAVQTTIPFEDIQDAPSRDINSIASTAAGVTQQDQGGELNIRGSRSDATSYYVDGIHVRGFFGVANQGAEQITVITGGLPAQYGDVTGGVISVTTRGPSRNWTGGVEASTSTFLDDYDNSTLSFALSGPIYTKKDAEGKKAAKSTAGFFLAGDYNYDKDPFPSAIGSYKVKDDILNSVRMHPLVKNDAGTGFNQRAVYFTLDSMDKTNARNNVSANGFTVNGKLDFNLATNLGLTFGGSFTYSKTHNFIDIYSLMNYDAQSINKDNTWRVFGKLTQRFGGTAESQKSASAIKSGFFALQFDYNQTNSVTENENHEDRIWDYGYVGQFTTSRAPFYVNALDTFYRPNDTLIGVYPTMVAYIDTEYSYKASDLNPYTSAYTSQYYDEAPQKAGFWQNRSQVISSSHGGLGNGDNRGPLNVYGLWASSGRIQSLYAVSQSNQFSIKASGQADIKNHTLILGMEYEQRVDRSYSVAANSLWDQARALGNFNIQNFNTDQGQEMFISDPGLNGQSVYINGVLTKLDTSNPTQDTLVNYNYQYVPTTNKDGDKAHGFYENLRDRLYGSDPNRYTYWVDMDHILPSFYRNSVDLFSMDELLSSGLLGFNNYGYDKTGNATSDLTDMNDFISKKDATNNFIRAIGPYSPTYVAGYIQDRFQFNDLTFNIGLRVDRFDANQKALKDNYLLYPAYTAGSDAVKNKFPTTVIPDGIGKDYVVYVNDAKNPSSILGYRNGDKWYDATGNSITDLSSLTSAGTTTGTIQPFLVDPSFSTNKTLDPNAFVDYEPQTNFMPRIAFAFPISTEANFKAHYDILTQRPPAGLVRFNPMSYYFMATGTGGNFSNGNLKPERTTDYEIQFEQRLTKSSAFAISAFYKEIHDQTEIINVTYAYPVDYTTYGNIDFGTVKGLTLGYDLRRTGNIRMNASYTLQFANGTGSSPGSNAGVLAAQGQTNLRELIPYDFDQRHTLVLTMDYHYASGKDYDGPVIKNSQILANAGLNMVVRANSGRPYSRQANVLPTADFTVNTRNTLEGSINGSRNPWNFRIDLKADKDFQLKMGKKASGDARKPLFMNVYFTVLNVLDTKNVLSVYKATGSASDDGYLSAPASQNLINQQVSPQAYRDQYYVAESNPGNYSLPRRMRLGVQLNF